MLRLVEQLKKLARGISPFRPGEEVCFFIPESSKGWILEAALREISDRFDGKYSICHDFALLPKSASAFYFVH